MLRAGRDNIAAADGFTLLEVVCVVAIIATFAMVLLPAIPRGTSRAQLEAYAIAVAAVLKADRNAAIRRGASISTQIDTASRLVRSGSTDRLVRIPTDVAFDALLAGRCGGAMPGSAISFLPSGMSCGGVIALTRLGWSFEVRANWLTGGVEIVSLNRT
jgi:general secretion pathway protein H